MEEAMRATSIWLVGLAIWLASCRETKAEDEVSKGHQLALMICSYCHVVSPDQPNVTILNPPGPSFESIAQRRDIMTDSLLKFLRTTHRNLDEGHGMPNSELIESHAKTVLNLLSLRR